MKTPFGTLVSNLRMTPRTSEVCTMNIEAALSHSRDEGIISETEFDQASYLVRTFKFVPEVSGPVLEALYGG